MNDLKIFKAIEFAARAHSGQFRRTVKVPYIVHPLGVAQILIENGCSEDVVIAGLLHDTVEDTSTTLNSIEKEFGVAVAELVEHASELPKTKYGWRERKEHKLKHLELASEDALLVCCADKLHNIQSISAEQLRLGNEIWHCFYGTKDDQKWYYETMALLFTRKLSHGPGKKLAKKFAEEVKTVFSHK